MLFFFINYDDILAIALYIVTMFFAMIVKRAHETQIRTTQYININIIYFYIYSYFFVMMPIHRARTLRF